MKLKNIHKGEVPLILSWVLMGNAYPVIERAQKNDSKSLYGQTCKNGFDSHYVLVKDETPDQQNSLSYQPCDPTKKLPDYDEIVIFNKDQILPRYLVYYKPINQNVDSFLESGFSALNLQRSPLPSTTTANQKSSKIINLFWVDQNDNSKLIKKMEENPIVVKQFDKTSQLHAYLDKIYDLIVTKQDFYFAVATNRFRKGDGDEVAGMRLLQSLRHKDSPWKSVIVILYCGNVKSVEKEFPKEENLFLTDNEAEFIKYILKVPRKPSQILPLQQTKTKETQQTKPKKKVT